jgi:protein-S-isoprenylcysteine O-methyltransferase Ste14
MFYILIGSLGFLVLQFLAIFSLKRIPRVKPITWIVGSGLVIYSLTMIWLQPDKLLLPTWSGWIGWGLFPISLSLLAYSLFVNLPFRKTYITTHLEGELVTTGLYTIVRHPWIYGFALLLLSLVLISKASLLLIASLIWIPLDILLLIIQDKLLFGKMFKKYDTYRQKTPMLLPNKRSVNAFIKSLRQDSVR